METYMLAQAAQRKLSTEASRPNQDLRIIVGHANFIDSLHMHLRDKAGEILGTSAAAATEDRRTTEAVIVRELEVEDDAGDDASDCRYGGGTGHGDDSVGVARFPLVSCG